MTHKGKHFVLKRPAKSLPNEVNNLILNFICTHNSRRSHLAQVWAQVASAHYHIPKVQCYSGGTEETALFPKVTETLSGQGFAVFKISERDNPVYAIKYGENDLPIIGFTKRYDSPFNPASAFAAVMTCSQVDAGVAIAVFGIHSLQAFVGVIGPLVEGPC